jgi:hypothetical protein
MAISIDFSLYAGRKSSRHGVTNPNAGRTETFRLCLELPRFRGHPMIGEKGVHDAEEGSSLPV